MADSQLLSSTVTTQAGGSREIKDLRQKRRVPLAPGGVVADYVPFYFAAPSPTFVSVIHGGGAYTGCADGIVYLSTTVGQIASAELACVYSDANAAMGYSQFHDDLTLIPTTLNWQVLEDRYWVDRDATESVNRTRKAQRQAEFLVHDFCPWPVFDEIVTMSARIKSRVEELLGESPSPHRPDVRVEPHWFAG